MKRPFVIVAITLLSGCAHNAETTQNFEGALNVWLAQPDQQICLSLPENAELPYRYTTTDSMLPPGLKDKTGARVNQPDDDTLNAITQLVKDGLLARKLVETDYVNVFFNSVKVPIYSVVLTAAGAGTMQLKRDAEYIPGTKIAIGSEKRTTFCGGHYVATVTKFEEVPNADPKTVLVTYTKRLAPDAKPWVHNVGRTLTNVPIQATLELVRGKGWQVVQ